MKKYFIISLTCIFFLACKNKTEHFIVDGFIINGDGQTVFFEHNGLNETIVIDSLLLNSIGQFSFQGVRPDYSDFYSLRIGDKRLTFVVDSTERITISGNSLRFSTDYTLFQSPNSMPVRQLRKSVINIQTKMNTLAKTAEDTQEYDELLEEIEADLANHRLLAHDIISKESRSPAAYFALYQQINNTYIFNPFDKNDLPYWRTVATAYNAYYPEYERSKNLNDFVLSVVRTLEEEKEAVRRQNALNTLMEKAVGYIEISLPDRNDEEKKLSDLKGQVVLINFFAYEYERGIDYTFNLRELYSKYHEQGFEIYQVALDRNKLFWEVATESLPWTCVHEGSSKYYASIYNVERVPTSFLMDKQGNIIARDLSWKNLDKKIEELIKERA